MATSSDPCPAPMAKTATTSIAGLQARGGKSSVAAKSSAVSRITRPAPNLGASRPASGIDTTAPAANASNAMLRAPSESANRSLKVGTDAAQVPMPRPLAKNTVVTAQRSAQDVSLSTRIPTLIGLLLAKGWRDERGRQARSSAREGSSARLSQPQDVSPPSWG